MKKKLQYNAPEMEVVEVKVEGTIMSASIEEVRRVNGNWDEYNND